jgi:uncharacterized pyridoxamine 5'-phosphate oxidase family protein
MDRVMKFLKENTVMALATSCNDKPRSSIMEYIMVGDAMIISTDPNSIKGKNLAKNPKISITLGGMPVYLAIDGSVKEASPKEIEEYNKVLVERYPMFKEAVESGVMPFKHFRVVFDTAYYSEGMGPDCTKIIQMKK